MEARVQVPKAVESTASSSGRPSQALGMPRQQGSGSPSMPPRQLQGSGSPIVPGPRKSASFELWVYLLGIGGISFRLFDLIIFRCCLSGRSA